MKRYFFCIFDIYNIFTYFIITLNLHDVILTIFSGLTFTKHQYSINVITVQVLKKISKVST